MGIQQIMNGKEMTLGNQLRIKRIMESKTQAVLSQELGIIQPKISKYERNLNEIEKEDYEKIISYLEN